MWPSGDRRFGWFRPQNHHVGRFPDCASKLGARSVWPDGGDGGHVAPSRSLRRGEAKSRGRRVRPMLLQKVR